MPTSGLSELQYWQQKKASEEAEELARKAVANNQKSKDRAQEELRRHRNAMRDKYIAESKNEILSRRSRCPSEAASLFENEFKSVGGKLNNISPEKQNEDLNMTDNSLKLSKQLHLCEQLTNRLRSQKEELDSKWKELEIREHHVEEKQMKTDDLYKKVQGMLDEIESKTEMFVQFEGDIVKQNCDFKLLQEEYAAVSVQNELAQNLLRNRNQKIHEYENILNDLHSLRRNRNLTSVSPAIIYINNTKGNVMKKTSIQQACYIKPQSPEELVTHRTIPLMIPNRKTSSPQQRSQATSVSEGLMIECPLRETGYRNIRLPDSREVIAAWQREQFV